MNQLEWLEIAVHMAAAVVAGDRMTQGDVIKIAGHLNDLLKSSGLEITEIAKEEAV